jgi:hypothetical protein
VVVVDSIERACLIWLAPPKRPISRRSLGSLVPLALQEKYFSVRHIHSSYRQFRQTNYGAGFSLKENARTCKIMPI